MNEKYPLGTKIEYPFSRLNIYSKGEIVKIKECLEYSTAGCRKLTLDYLVSFPNGVNVWQSEIDLDRLKEVMGEFK